MDKATLIWIVLILAVLGLGTGLVAAGLWLQASNVPLRTTAEGQTESGLPDVAMNSAIGGLFKAGSDSAPLNARAAKWTAASVVLNGISAVLGAVLNFH